MNRPWWVAAWGHAPSAVVLFLSKCVAWLCGSIFRIRRDHVERAMQEAGIADVHRVAQEMYRGLAASLLETVWTWGSPTRLNRLVKWSEPTTKVLGDLFRNGPVVFAASHTGNWELSLSHLGQQTSVACLVKRMHVLWIDRLVQRMRSSFGITTVRAREGLFEMLRELRHGVSAVAMVDQVPMRRAQGVEASFLGRKAWHDRTPAVLAARSGRPLVVVAASRGGECSILGILNPPRIARAAWVDRATIECANLLESFVQEHPADWLWMHRRWKEPAQA